MKNKEVTTLMELLILADRASEVNNHRAQMRYIAEAARVATGIAADLVTRLQSVASDAVDAAKEVAEPKGPIHAD